jgi:hypothetical protein
LAVLALIGGVIFLIALSGTSPTDDLITETEQAISQTESMRALTDRTRSQIADIETLMQEAAQASYERGRQLADEEWFGRG